MSNPNVQIQISANDQASGIIDRVRQRFGELDRDTERVTRRFTELNSALSSLGAVLSVGAVAAMTKSFVDAGLQMERLNRLFAAAAGSANLGGREMEYVKQVSDRMGLSVQTTAASYGKFMAAIRGTTVEGEQGRKIFESVSGAATALGLSADETSGIFNALQQMMSKGKVQAEELRGQLGERLPGAFKMAADAMGITTAELDKMLKDGKVLASDLLPKLAEELDKTYGKAAAEGAKSAAAEMNRLNTAMFDTKAAAGAALMPVFTDIVKALKPAVEMLRDFIVGIQILAVKAASLPDKIAALKDRGLFLPTQRNQDIYNSRMAGITADEDAVIADIMKRFTLQGSDYTAAEKARQAAAAEKARQAAAAEKARQAAAAEKANKWTLSGDLLYKNMKTYADMLKKQEEGFYHLGQELEGAAAAESRVFDIMTMQGGDLKTDRYNVTPLSKYRFMTNKQYSIPQSGPDQSEIDAAVKKHEELLRLEKQFNEQMMASKIDLATQGLELLEATSAKGSAIAIAAQAAQKAMAVFSIIMSTNKAAAAALEPPPIGLGPIAGAGLSASIEAMGYTKAALTGAMGIFQIAGQRAFGGPVLGGSTYLVGENGPELFTPGASGMITPNDRIGAAGVSITQHLSVTGVGAELTENMKMLARQAKDQAVTAVLQSMNRGGAFAVASGRR